MEMWISMTVVRFGDRQSRADPLDRQWLTKGKFPKYFTVTALLLEESIFPQETRRCHTQST